jgi:replication factor A1
MGSSGRVMEVEAVYKRALFFEGLFSLKVKSETYNDEARVKVVCNAMQPLSLADESKQLIDAINSFA